MKLKIFQVFDYFLLLAVITLVTIGVFFIYSSGINSEGVNVSTEYIKQIIWASIGVVLMFVMALADYRKFERYLPYMYVFLIVILIYTRLFGKYVNGAKSWLGFAGFGIQPSEFCKVIYILFLARYFNKSKNISDKKRFFVSLCIMFVPMGLILLQPDLGTASVYFPIYLAMAFVAGVPLRFILMLVIGGLSTILFAVLPIWESEIAQKSYKVIVLLTNYKYRLLIVLAFGAISIIGMLGKLFFKNNKYYYWIAYISGILCASLVLSEVVGHVLKDYQIKRLIVFIDPNCDPRGSGWNIIQSKIAIGSGNLFGQGYLRGTQSHYRFLPQQSTDFIFSILSEEIGFVGCMVVYGLYFLILLRTIFIIRETNNNFGYYIASGILGMLFFHFVVNVGMVMGIMPITGIPLIFLSYGGSSLWTAMLCMGLLMSIEYRKYDFNS